MSNKPTDPIAGDGDSATSTSKKVTGKHDNDNVINDEVHSANSWETADLGDQTRNNKFLRLMGASKKEHHGRFVIGDKSPVHNKAKNRNESENLDDNLADQYEQSMEYRLTSGPRGHLGLGFHPDNGANKNEPVKESAEDLQLEKDKSKTEESKATQDTSTSQEKDDCKKDSTDRKRQSTDNDDGKMKFVKSSS